MGLVLPDQDRTAFGRLCSSTVAPKDIRGARCVKLTFGCPCRPASRSSCETETVREYLQRAAWWSWSLILGLWCFAWWALFLKVVDRRSTGAALAGAGVFAVLGGAVLGPLVARMNARFRIAVGPVPEDVQRAAGRALWRGPVPEDQVVQETALRLAEHQLTEGARTRRWGVLALGAALALEVVMAVRTAAWHLLAAVVVGVALGLAVVVPRRDQRRAALLRRADAGGSGATPGGGSGVAGSPSSKVSRSPSRR